ncbi:ABC transporter substrate-binding protein [Paenibacillus paridis]|uniref:ABC transporter substrate-binding protein n=1 Tax=Paenibacillus paridis TaxID=2583376 RepID=UPI00111FC212|nr:extracellular solute-binding protein [Paenibacillus paridis]
MMKKWIGGAVSLLLLLCLVISGCSSKNSEAAGGEAASDEKQVDLTLLSSWSTDTERGKALQTVVENFNKENENKIKVTVDINPDWPALQQKVKTMIAAGQTPDIFNYNFNPNDLSRQKSGKLLNLTEYMDDAWKSRFTEQDLQAMTVDGELTSIPFEKAGILFYYNKDLFAKAGIEAFPTTWDEFFDVCEKLKDAGITPISLMTADDAWHATNAFTYLAASLGGTSVFDAGKSLDTPEVVKAAEYMKKLFGYTTADALGGNYSVSSNNFLTGSTAMIIDGPWLIGSISEELSPSIAVAASPTFGDGKVQPGFTVTDTYTPWSSGKKNSKEKEEAAVAFLKYMTSEESSKIFTLEGSILLSTKLTLTEEETTQAGPILGQYIKTNSEAPESIVNLVRNLKPAAASKLPSLIEGMMFDRYTPEQFVKQLQEVNQ